jgi:hypothetical protein
MPPMARSAKSAKANLREPFGGSSKDPEKGRQRSIRAKFACGLCPEFGYLVRAAVQSMAQGVHQGGDY